MEGKPRPESLGDQLIFGCCDPRVALDPEGKRGPAFTVRMKRVSKQELKRRKERLLKGE